VLGLFCASFGFDVLMILYFPSTETYINTYL